MKLTVVDLPLIHLMKIFFVYLCATYENCVCNIRELHAVAIYFALFAFRPRLVGTLGEEMVCLFPDRSLLLLNTQGQQEMNTHSFQLVSFPLVCAMNITTPCMFQPLAGRERSPA